jgi:hypothetical protein
MYLKKTRQSSLVRRWMMSASDDETVQFSEESKGEKDNNYQLGFYELKVQPSGCISLGLHRLPP